MHYFLSTLCFVLLLIVPSLQDGEVKYHSDNWYDSDSHTERNEPVDLVIRKKTIVLQILEDEKVFEIIGFNEEDEGKVIYEASLDGKVYTFKILTFHNDTIIIKGEGINLILNPKKEEG